MWVAKTKAARGKIRQGRASNGAAMGAIETSSKKSQYSSVHRLKSPFQTKFACIECGSKRARAAKAGKVSASSAQEVRDWHSALQGQQKEIKELITVVR